VSYQHEMPADWRMEAEEQRAQCDRLRQDLETVIGERRDAQNDLAHALEERDALQAQLTAERQGAIARERALEEATELLRRARRFLPQTSNLRAGHADPAAHELIDVTHAISRFLATRPEEGER
jgi:chromosome segregation ATPase